MKPIPPHIGQFTQRELYLLNSIRDLDRKLNEFQARMETGRSHRKWIHQMWGGGIIAAWQGWSAAITRLRERAERPTTYHNFQRLAEMMEQMEPGRVSGA